MRTTLCCLALPLLGALYLPPLAAAPGSGPDVMAEKIILIAPAGSRPEDALVGKWQERVRATPSEESAYERLGWAYIGEARATLDAGYYKLAEKTADAMAARFGADPTEELLRGHVFDSLHRFREAETVARHLVAVRGLPYDYALLSDALMEQGQLPEAIAACQREMSLRPGLEAYSRAAHLRFLSGDIPGAVQAMEQAVEAGSAADPTSLAWTLSQLSTLYLADGRSRLALAAAEAARKQAGQYPAALLAEGRALAAVGRVAEAIAPLAEAARLCPLPEYQWWLADALRASGRADEAVKTENEIRRLGPASDPRTTALFLATRVQATDEAVRLATAELETRRDVFTYDALAWALAAQGNYAQAETAMRSALATGTRDARVYLHAGEIARRLGDARGAAADFANARLLAGTLTPSERALLAPSPANPGRVASAP